MSRYRWFSILAAGVMVALPVGGFAESVSHGPDEVGGRLSYTSIDYGSFDSNQTNIDVSYGRYLTEMNEVGVTVGYFRNEFEDESADGVTLGAFYALNFPTSSILTPYVGINAAWLGGDVGDVFDFQYGVGAGLKIYPYEHSGISVGVAYQRLQGAESYIDDANGLSFVVGLLMRFGGTGRAAGAASTASLSAVPVETMCTQPSRVDQAQCRGLVRIGMTRDEAMQALGVPDGKSADAKILRYGNRYLIFDDVGRLSEISESKVK